MGSGARRLSAWAIVVVGAWASAAPAQPVAAPPAEARRFVPDRRGANRWEGSLAAASLGAQLRPGPGSGLDLFAGFGLLPRVWLGRGFQLRASLTLSHGFTAGDSTTSSRTSLDDGDVTLWFHGIPSFAGFHPAVAAGLVLPLSEASRAYSFLLGTLVMGQLAWWRRASSVTLFARVSVGWRHNVFEYTSRSGSWLPYSPCFMSSGGDCISTDGPSAITDLVWTSLTFAPRWRYVSPGVSLAYALGLPTYDGPYPRASSFGANGGVTTFSAWVEFIPTPPVSLVLSYTLSRPVLDADGTYGNPFWSSSYGPVFSLAVALRVDALASLLRGEPLSPGGIVRW